MGGWEEAASREEISKGQDESGTGPGWVWTTASVLVQPFGFRLG